MTTTNGPTWYAWKQHLIRCAHCTAGAVCADGRSLLGAASPGDAPWLRERAADAAGENVLAVLDRCMAVYNGFNVSVEQAFKPITDRLAAAEQQAAALRAEVDEAQRNYEGACQTIALMHAAAVGEVRGPTRGVVEDVADLRAEVERLLLALRLVGQRPHQAAYIAREALLSRPATEPENNAARAATEGRDGD